MSWLNCPHCDEPVFESDADDLFCEDDEAICPRCGMRCIVGCDGIDGDEAYVQYTEEFPHGEKPEPDEEREPDTLKNLGVEWRP